MFSLSWYSFDGDLSSGLTWYLYLPGIIRGNKDLMRFIPNPKALGASTLDRQRG